MRASPKKTKRVLTEAEWSKVFDARCRSKRGEALTDEQRALVDAAYDSDPKRYVSLEPRVFNALSRSCFETASRATAASKCVVIEAYSRTNLGAAIASSSVTLMRAEQIGTEER
jgi:hypothetical protein